MHMNNIERCQERLTQAETFRHKTGRPFILISYAQSVNGSIASRSREPIQLSGPQSSILTHRLRALCDGILVGIGTVLSDDPRLTVRLIDGKNPQPIVLDSRLRSPLDAALLQRRDVSSWVVCGPHNDQEKHDRLRRAGVTILPCATDEDGSIDLFALMRLLAKMNMNSVMVEGGAQVIASFIDAKLVDQFVITIVPKLFSGLQVIDTSKRTVIHDVEMRYVEYERLGEDLIVWARPTWGNRE